MINILKSKFFLGTLLFISMFLIVIFSKAISAVAQTNIQPPIQNCSIVNTLKMGSTGAEVKCLQVILGINVDGVFGTSTKNAVIDFQESNGLVADGVFGPLSYISWQNKSSPVNSSPSTTPTATTTTT